MWHFGDTGKDPPHVTWHFSFSKKYKLFKATVKKTENYCSKRAKMSRDTLADPVPPRM